MSKRLSSGRLTRMQRQLIVRNLYSRANFTFQHKLIEKIERVQKKLEDEKKSSEEIEAYRDRMRNYRSEWMQRCQIIEDSFIGFISNEEQAHIDDEKFFNLLTGLGFKDIDHDSIIDQELLSGYYEECDPDAVIENESLTENAPESKDRDRENQSSIEEDEEDVTDSKEKQEDVESQLTKELV